MIWLMVKPYHLVAPDPFVGHFDLALLLLLFWKATCGGKEGNGSGLLPGCCLRGRRCWLLPWCCWGRCGWGLLPCCYWNRRRCCLLLKCSWSYRGVWLLPCPRRLLPCARRSRRQPRRSQIRREFPTCIQLCNHKCL